MAEALPLAGRVALITGASRGIGRAVALALGAAGATVACCARSAEQIEATAAEVGGHGGRARGFRLDVTRRNEIDTVVADIGAALGPIDILVNNAGVYNDRSGCASGDDACPGSYQTQSFGQLDFALLDTITDVNIKGPLIVSQTFYPNVKASSLKKIVAVSSSNGTITGELPNPWPGATFYRMSKAALNREMQIVASSVKADGVTVVILNPGPTLTEHQEFLRGNPIMLEMSFTVENMINTIAKTTLAETGQFWRYDGVPEKW